MKIFFYYFHQILKKYRSAFIKSLIYILILTALQVLIPVSLRLFVKEVEERQKYSFFVIGLLGYTFYLLLINLANIGWYMSLNKLGGKIMQGIREDLLKVISKAHYEELLGIGKDKLKNILFMDTLNVFSSVAHLSIQIISNFILLIVFLIVSSYLSLRLTIILFIASIIGFLISFFSRKTITNSSRRVNAEMKANNQMMNEYIDDLELIKTNNLDEYFLQKNQTSLWHFINTSIQADKKQIFLKNVIEHFHQLVSIGLAAFLSMTTSDHSAGDLVFYLFVSDMVLHNSQSIESSIYTLMKMLPSFEHIDAILNLKQCNGSKKVNNIQKIEFKNVDFYYEANKEKIIIKDANASFKSGDIVRVSGLNGSGKSTFVKLMVGLLQPKNGQILLDGISINEIDANCLKQQIVYIDQDEIILNDEIKNYMKVMTNQPITDAELNKLMRLVQFDNEITNVSENGQSLSGGQRKKLLMMKLLLRYKSASIIILDEIEAGLDSETKKIILKLEKEIISNQSNRIIFKISHENSETNLYTKTIEF